MSEKHSLCKFSKSQVVEIVKRLYRLTASEISSFPSYEDQNFYVASSDGGEYILKIMNPQNSKNLALIDVQTFAMSFLRQNGLPTQTALPTISGELMSLEEIGHPLNSFIRYGITTWFGNLSVKLRSQLQNLIKRAGKIIGMQPPSSLQEIFEETARKQGLKITCDPNHILHKEYELLPSDCGYGCQKYLVRMLTYLPGTMSSNVPLTPQLLYEIGKMAAKMDKILQKHPYLNTLERGNFTWYLTNTPLLEAYIYVLDDEALQKVVKSVIHQYKTLVIPKLSHFHEGIIHSDFNDRNILVQPHESDGHRISGIIDFGDLNRGYFISELAVTTAHMVMRHQTPIEAGGPILAGWESVIPLNESEKDCLYVLVLSRLCQILVLVRHSLIQNPENEEYFMSACRNVIGCLCHLWELGKEEVEKVWFETAAQISEREGQTRGESHSDTQ